MHTSLIMSRYFPVLFAGLLSMGMNAGCSSSQMSRIDRNRDAYETWPVEIRQAVLDGKIEQGMTPEMVEVSWGRPTEIVAQGSTGDEVWVYSTGGDPGSVMYPGGAVYPGGGYPRGPSITVGTGGPMGGGIGIGGGMGGGGVGYPGGGMGYPGGGMGYPRAGGMGTPIVTPPTRPEIREVVFRNGVVHRADEPPR